MDGVELEAFAGYEATVTDLAQAARGLRAGGALRPTPWLGAVLVGGVYPDLGGTEMKYILKQLIDLDGPLPDVSRVVAQGALLAEVTPIRTEGGPISTALRLGLGGGVIHTVDDLARFGAVGSFQFEQDRSELHPQLVWTVAGEARRGPVGLRGRYGQSRYVEEVGARGQGRKPVWLGLELVVAAPVSSGG